MKELFRKIKFFKLITYLNRYFGGDMSYPPFLVWERNLKISQIKKGWEELEKEISEKEKNQDRVGIYVHIPFCKSKCFYCNLLSFPEIKEEKYDLYLQCLEKEIKFLNFSKKIEIHTLYIGGGTPSILSPLQLKKLFEMIYKNFNLSNSQQIMIEVSPFTIDSEKIKVLKMFGVNKVTIGVQTLDSKVLERVNRPQTEKEVISSYFSLREAGIKYINIDLMVGLPGQTLESFVKTLKRILRLKPDTIHLNPFFPAIFTPFSVSGQELSKKEISERLKMIEVGRKIIDEYYPYAFERDGLEKENLQLFNSSKYASSLLGIGWGAISHIRKRFHYGKGNIIFLNYNHFLTSFHQYLNCLLKNKFPPLIGYKLSLEEEMRANIIYSLEKEKMFDISVFKSLFKKDPLKIFQKEFNILFDLRKIKKEGEIIKLCSKDNLSPFIYSKFFYSKPVVEKFKKFKKKYAKELKNIEEKLLHFYEI